MDEAAYIAFVRDGTTIWYKGPVQINAALRCLLPISRQQRQKSSTRSIETLITRSIVVIAAAPLQITERQFVAPVERQRVHARDGDGQLRHLEHAAPAKCAQAIEQMVRTYAFST